jgi:hypothetical protein
MVARRICFSAAFVAFVRCCEVIISQVISHMNSRPANRKKRQAALRRKTSVPAGYFTREMLCASLGITDRDARALAAKGILKADAQNDGNFALYSSETVQRLQVRKAQGKLWEAPAVARNAATAYTTEQGVRVFEQLEAKKPAARIVIEERLHPQVFRQIRSDYEHVVGEMELPRASVERINEIAIRQGEEPVRSTTDLLLLIEKLARPRRCPRCARNPSTTLCFGCASSRLR